MTHFNNARINEMLGLQLGIIKNIALKLDGNDIEQLESNLAEMEVAMKDIKSMVEGLPHPHQA